MTNKKFLQTIVYLLEKIDKQLKRGTLGRNIIEGFSYPESIRNLSENAQYFLELQTKEDKSKGVVEPQEEIYTSKDKRDSRKDDWSSISESLRSSYNATMNPIKSSRIAYSSEIREIPELTEICSLKATPIPGQTALDNTLNGDFGHEDPMIEEEMKVEPWRATVTGTENQAKVAIKNANQGFRLNIDNGR